MALTTSWSPRGAVSRWRALTAPWPDAGRPLLAGMSLLFAVRAALPPLTALALGAVVTDGQRGGLAGAWGAVLLVGAAIIVGQVLETAIEPLLVLAHLRMEGAHRERLAARALAAPTLDRLEDPAVQDLLRLASPERGAWTEAQVASGALSALMGPWQYVSVAASALVLTRFSWWLAPVVVVPALVVRLDGVHLLVRHARVFTSVAPLARRVEYWSDVAGSAGPGKEIRVFGLADHLVDRHRAIGAAYHGPLVADEARATWRKGGHALVMVVVLSAAFALVGLGTRPGSAGLALETTVLIAIWSTFQALSGIWSAFSGVAARSAVEATVRLDALLPAPARPAPAPTAAPPVPPDAPAPEILVDRLAFTYPGGSRPVLDGVDLRLAPGEVVGLVGLNGAGKSTLLKLLSGLYRPTAGRVLVDGAELGAPGPGGLDVEEHRRRLSVVVQEFVRYPLSIEDNVRLGAPGSLDAEALHAAARDAGLDQLVADLPQGWATPLSRGIEGGVDLSGGQWQLVVLARALYAVRRGARLLVLDEPTAHLDVRTEARIFARLTAARRGASVLLVTHRLATVRDADRIVVLDGGVIAEQGRHDDLMARGGRYAQLFALQAARFARGGDGADDQDDDLADALRDGPEGDER